MVRDRARWTRTADDEYYTPAIPGTPVADTDLVYFKACGIMLRLAFLWGQDTIPISPMLLALLISGPEAAMDREFLSALAPEIAKRLATWPPQRIPSRERPEQMVYDVSTGKDPMNLVGQYVPGNTHVSRAVSISGSTLNIKPLQVTHIMNLSPAGIESLNTLIQSGLLFEAREPTHPIFDALRLGLNHLNLTKLHLGTTVRSTLLQVIYKRPVFLHLLTNYSDFRRSACATDNSWSLCESLRHTLCSVDPAANARGRHRELPS